MTPVVHAQISLSLLVGIEEADEQVVPYVQLAVRKGVDKVVVLSNDTDTIAVLLYYIPRFSQIGLKELWLQYGTDEHSRMLPLHHLYDQQGCCAG